MSVLPNNVEPWSLPDTLLGKFVPFKCGSSGGSLRLYIPMLMPMVSFGKAKVVVEPLPNSAFINDPACKPSTRTTISTQNYKTVPSLARRSFEFGYLYHGDSVQIEVHNHNPELLFVTTKVDNSHKKPI